MSEKTKENRIIRSKRLLKKLKNPEEEEVILFFSDDKNLDQDKKINRRNDRWLCNDMHIKFPVFRGFRDCQQ